MSTSDWQNDQAPAPTSPPLSISLIAGYRSDGEPVMEKITVSVVEPDPAAKNATGTQYRLLNSPGFIRGLAAGDRIRYPAETETGYELIKRSGNLCIRVLRKDNMEEVAQVLTPKLELMDGSLDLQSPRLLIYSIHVTIGFQPIEIILDRVTGQFPGTVWYYGNVYDPTDGVTPLEWWQEFLAPV
ncbi:MAG: DUF4265 domain-containing protein [Gammaproteobacteria bacterium]|nr:DUF4265 domain-containing protein [Gammaproteobacteria bacterium]MDP2139612.1 DUF4265 domain-containing protein [Gammaproteobacteria bacterium]MDP2346585.1 DUF4265 domain-containing protein [Gammaproteobacteria bacterium]